MTNHADPDQLASSLFAKEGQSRLSRTMVNILSVENLKSVTLTAKVNKQIPSGINVPCLIFINEQVNQRIIGPVSLTWNVLFWACTKTHG